MTRTWQDIENEANFSFKNGEQRVVLLSRFISPQDKSILDLGAGNLFLGNILPDGFSYYPVDYKQRSGNTTVCDFNKKEFPETNTDIAFISGTLEFVEDPEWFLSEAAKHSSKIIISYNPVTDKSAVNIEERRNNAWINDLTKDEIINIMHSKGFLLDRESDVMREEAFFCFLKAAPQTLRRNYFCPCCGACVNVCPKDALRIEPDSNGLYRPSLDANACTNCGKCTGVCPVVNPVKNSNDSNPKCFEFIAGDDEVLFNSSSGGVFPLLAKKVLDDGGVVCGVAWRDDFSAAHIFVENEADLHKIQKSKYLQSDVGDIYRQIKLKLESGVTVLFSGCPCHATGLRSFLGQEYENLYCVDLLCAQAPSASLFQKYLKDTFADKKIQHYEFRNKTQGWNCSTHSIKFSDGTVNVRGQDDPYQRVFHNRTMAPDACNWCRFSLAPRQADITIGDFWGIEKRDKEISSNYKNGISAVLINSAKGQKLFNAITPKAHVVREVSTEWLGDNGSVFNTRDGKTSDIRDSFFKLTKKLSFPKAVDAVTKKHFDIGLIGWWYGRNFGSLMTYYALHKTLINMGYSVLMIKEALGYNSRFLSYETSPTGIFARKHYQYVPNRHFPDFVQRNSQCDMFLTGSDQQWNYRIPSVNDDFFLNFVNNTNKKIAYATSFGNKVHTPPYEKKLRFSFLLQQYDAISVREDYAVDIAKDVYNVNAMQALEPVFLLDVNDYSELAKESTFRCKEDFLAAYILEPTQEKKNMIVEIARRLNLKVIVMTDMNKAWSEDTAIRYEAKNVFDEITVLDMEEHIPENFCYIYSRCKYVVTDSFHGTCFAYIFKKSFSVFYNTKRGADRFESLMQIIGLENRRIYESDANSVTDEMLQPVDFSYADSRIAAMRSKSLDWLKTALEMPKENEPVAYDFVKRDIYEINAKVDNSLQRTDKLRMALEPTLLPLRQPLLSLALRAIRERNLREYLRILPELAENFLVIIAVKDTPGNCIDKEIVSQLHAAGLKKDLQDKLWRSYIAVIERGRLLHENLGNGNEPSLWYDDITSDKIKVTSKVWTNGNLAEIEINGIDYAVNERGLNIVIFDRRTGCYIDSVCFDAHVPAFNCSRGSAEKWVNWFAARSAIFNRHETDKYPRRILKIPRNLWEKGLRYLNENGFPATFRRLVKRFF